MTQHSRFQLEAAKAGLDLGQAFAAMTLQERKQERVRLKVAVDDMNKLEQSDSNKEEAKARRDALEKAIIERLLRFQRRGAVDKGRNPSTSP